MNIVEIICQRARQYGDKRALIQGERTVSYSAFAAGVEKVADELGRMGLRGSHVALRVSNSIEDLILALGVILAGHALVALPPEATDAEMRQHLACCNAAIMLHAEGPSFVFEQLPDSAESPGEGIAFIRPTSGTTGRSKGVMLSHSCMHARIASASSMLDLSPDDTIFWTLPVHLHFASSVLLYLHAGATIVLAGASPLGHQLADILRHRTTLLYGTPWHFRRLAADQSGQRVNLLRLAISTGQPLPVEVAETFARRFDMPLRQAYGVIEAGLVSINADSIPASSETVGRIAPGFTVTVTDDKGLSLPDGNTGDVCIAGAALFAGYTHDRERQVSKQRESVFVSGDMGKLQGDVLTLQGRRSSLVNVAGHKIFPEEVEAVLERHAGVLQAQVYGIPDCRMGQLLMAEVVPGAGSDPNPSELVRHCREYLSPYKIPLGITLVENICVTPSGKILR